MDGSVGGWIDRCITDNPTDLRSYRLHFKHIFDKLIQVMEYEFCPIAMDRVKYLTDKEQKKNSILCTLSQAVV